MRSLFLLLLLILSCGTLSAQVRISGTVAENATGKPIFRAALRLKKGDGAGKYRTVAYTFTNEKGEYLLSHTPESEDYILECGLLGYNKESIKPDWKDKSSIKVDFLLREERLVLPDVTVKSKPIRQSGDTITYSVGQIARKVDRTLESVLKRLPGISVEPSGEIKYNGKEISKFYIEDLDLLGGRYALATKNIRPEDVASIQVYENHQPIRVKKDTDPSDKAALNIRLKQKAFGRWLGLMEVIGGLSGKKVEYGGAVTAMSFHRKSQTLLVGKGNTFGREYMAEQTDFLSLDPGSAMGSAFKIPYSGPPVDKERYERGRSGFTSGNTLFKTGSYTTLKLNAQYNGSDYGYRSQEKIEYIDKNAKVANATLTEDIAVSLPEYSSMMGVVYDHNSPALYLLSDTKLFWSRRKNMAEINSSKGLYFLENSKANIYNLYNTTKVDKKLGEGVFSIYSTIGYKSMPDYFLEIFSEKGKYADQKINDRDLNFKIGSGWAWILRQRFVLDLSGGITARSSRIRTIGKYTNRDKMENDFEGFEADANVTPRISFNGAKSRFSLTLPLRYRLSNPKNRLGKSLPVGSDWAMGGNVNVHLSPSSSNTWTINAGLNKSLTGVDRYLSAPIIRTHRYLHTSGTGSDMSEWRGNTSLTWNYKNLNNAFFLNATAGYSIVLKNTLSSLSVDENMNEVVSVHSRKGSTNQMYTLLGDVGKTFFEAGLTLKLNGGVVFGRNDILFNNEVLNVMSGRLNLSPSIYYFPFKNLSFRLDADLSIYDMKIHNQSEGRRRRFDTGAELLVDYSVTDPLEFYGIVKYLALTSEEDNLENNFDISVGLRYKREFWEMWFEGRNLGREKELVRQFYSDLMIRSMRYSLRPFTLEAGIRFSW
ncbi:MAG: carboxypeptidase-like regulatory domain-containing protein [Porphyromonas sp.]|nr:carboxypeptidase-like regulatory domain-containing protein [Porphyromonas sp.]